jgi:hypothetical protein
MMPMDVRPLRDTLPTGPEISWFRLNGHRYAIRYWTQRQWDLVPSAGRSGLATPSASGDGWFDMQLDDPAP